MPRTDPGLIAAAVLPGAVITAAAAAVVAAVGVTQPTPEAAQAWRQAVDAAMPLLVMAGLGVAAVAGAAGVALWRRFAAAPARLAGQLQVLVASDVERRLPLQGSAGSQALAEAVNALLDQRKALRDDVHQRVQEAARGVEQERERLATLMSELTQSVVVCNVDGRILLYNNRARLQFRALSDAPSSSRGNELLGLGRSIYAVFEPELVAHALDSLRDRLRRGASHPVAQFVTTTRGGQLLRVQMAAVRSTDEEPPAPARADPPIAGFVLVLDNLTREYAEATAQDATVLDLATRAKAALAAGGDASPAIEALLALAGRALRQRWPMEDMLATDLLSAVARRIGAELALPVQVCEPEQAGAWLRVDSYGLVRCLVVMAQRVAREEQPQALALGLQVEEQGVLLTMSWQAQAAARPASDAFAWVSLKTTPAGQAVQDVLERHEAALSCDAQAGGAGCTLALRLPRMPERPASAEVEGEPRASRPEFYDFDLFRTSTAASRAWTERPLDELAYTVFDTETTGLEPSGGDEILQIGATRVVAGKVRRQETYEQLVDPRRRIPAASIPIHGIEPAMVAGQPTIEVVLPAFRDFVADTVLVAHNAAFDMRFLQLKEEATGVRFDQPVLDTLLLSAVLHPDEPSHQLEDIAARFGVNVLGRHTALGDAFVTAEIFARMVPLLRARGLLTLGQALDASRRTRFAKVEY